MSGAVVTLQDGRKFFVALTGTDTRKWKTVRKLSRLSHCLMHVLGQATIDNSLYNVYEYCSNGLLSAQISLMASGRHLLWTEPTLRSLFTSMLSALHALHSCWFLHCHVTPEMFHVTATGEARLARLEKVIKVKKESFTTNQQLEMQRLGCCFLSMVSFKPYSTVRKTPPGHQFTVYMQQSCVQLSVEMQSVIKGALAGSPPGELLSLLAPQCPSERTNIKDVTGELDTLTRLGTVIDQSPVCSVCESPSALTPPCNHPLCFVCLQRYLQKLLLKSRCYSESIVCKLCDKPLDVSAVFTAIMDDQGLVRKLQECLLLSETVPCPECERPNYIGERKLVNVRCVFCTRKFCGNCGKKRHLFDVCPDGERKE